MGRFLLGLLTVILTTAVLLGGGLLLAKQEESSPEIRDIPETTSAEEPAFAEITLPAVTEAIQATVPEPLPVTNTVDRVPLYYQTDYPYIKFGNGTIATSGCSITCLAMVATYLTNQEYTPPQMAHHFGSYGKTNIERLDYGLAQMQLPYQRSENIQEVLAALRSGKVVIAMMDEESVFTTEQHFIVLAGINEAGKFLVNDPMETNYTNADVHVRNAYDNGFESYHLSQGFSGAWIFDKNDMPEEPFLFDATLPQQQENRYEGYTLTDEDIYMLACFVWAEAGKESLEVQQAVAEVVLNRLVSDQYPNTVRDVIYETEFYRAVKTMSKWKEENFDPYIAVNTAMYGPYVLPEYVCFYSRYEKGQEVWGQLGKYTFSKHR